MSCISTTNQAVFHLEQGKMVKLNRKFLVNLIMVKADQYYIAIFNNGLRRQRIFLAKELEVHELLNSFFEFQSMKGEVLSRETFLSYVKPYNVRILKPKGLTKSE